MRNAGGRNLSRRTRWQRLFLQDDAPGIDQTKSGQRLNKFGLAIPLHPGDCKDLTAPNFKRGVVYGESTRVIENVEPLHLEDRLGNVRLGSTDGELHLATNHHFGKDRCGRLRWSCLTSHCATAQHGDLVRNGDHFVQLVRDEDHRRPTLGKATNDVEELFSFLRREHR